MTAVPGERLLALAVFAALEAELGAGKVGYGTKPSGGGWATTPPTAATAFVGYAVVWPGQTTATGPVSSHFSDAAQGFQVSCYGKSGDQADAIRDRCRTKVLTTALAVSGRSVNLVELADSSPLSRDDGVSPPVFQAADRFIAYTTPA